MSSPSPLAPMEHKMSTSTKLSKNDLEAKVLISEADDLVETLIWADPDSIITRWEDAWRKHLSGGSSLPLPIITRAIERRAEPLLHFKGSLFLSAYCDYDQEYDAGFSTLENTTLTNVDKSAKDDIGNVCRIWQELFRGRLLSACIGIFTAGLFVEDPEIVSSVLRILAGIFHWCAMEIEELDTFTYIPEVVHLAQAFHESAWSHRHIFQTGATMDSLSDATCYMYSIPVTNGDNLFPEIGEVLENACHIALMCWMQGSKMPLQNAEVIERTDHQCQLDYMFLGAIGGLVLGQPGGNPEVYTAKFDKLNELIELDIIEIYGAPAYFSRLNQFLRASDLFDDPDEDVAHKLSVFHLTMTHPGVVPHLNSSGMLLTMRLLADQQARFGSLSTELAVLREVLEVMRAAFDYAPVPDGSGPLIRKYDFVAILARGLRAYADEEATTERNTRAHKHGDSQALVEILKSFHAFVKAIGARSDGKNSLRKALRKALREQWYITLRALQGAAGHVDGEVKSKLMRMRLLWSAAGHDIGLDEAQEREEFERLEKQKEQMCSWIACEYHTQVPPLSVKTCKGCGQTRYCSRDCQVKDWKEGGTKLSVRE